MTHHDFTSQDSPASLARPGLTRATGLARRALTRPFLQLSWAIAALLLLAAFVPGRITVNDPLFGELDRLLPPVGDHLFGTDNFGRDLFARVVFGAQETVKAVIIAVLVGLLLGSTLGLVAGWYGGLADDAIMQLVDVLLSVPTLMIALAIIAVLGFGTVNLAIAVGIGSVASFARVMRGEILRRRAADWIEASAFCAVASGADRAPAQCLRSHRGSGHDRGRLVDPFDFGAQLSGFWRARPGTRMGPADRHGARLPRHGLVGRDHSGAGSGNQRNRAQHHRGSIAERGAE